MARPKPKTTFTYDDIAKTTGLTYKGLQKAIERGQVDPQNLKSLAAFVTARVLLDKAAGG